MAAPSRIITVNANRETSETLAGANPLHLAQGWIQAGKPSKAIRILEPLLAGPDTDPEVINLRGLAAYVQHRHEEAIGWFHQALARRPTNPVFHYNLGNALRKLGSYGEAVISLEQATALHPDFAEAHHALGLVFKIQGKVGRAMEAYERALAIKPTLHYVQWGLASLKRHTDEDNTVEDLKRLLSRRNIEPAAEIYLSFAIAKQLDDLDDFPSASTYLGRGNSAKRRTVACDPAANTCFVDETIRCFDGFPKGPWDDDTRAGPLPIFVVGMPRGGSSLLEQILAGHSRVVGIGETGAMPDLFSQIQPRTERSGEGIRERMRRFMSGDFRSLGDRYLERVGWQSMKTSHFVDKTLSNFRYIGFIRMMFPQARIIHIRRDPRDQCLGIYRQLFSEGHDYSYEPLELVTYHKEYRRLMAYWQARLPDFILDLSYEDLVRDPEAQIRRCLEFCDLPWEAECLSSHENDRPVNTASAVQVREPIHDRSIGRWRGYEPYLSRLFEPLAEA